jgi:hypothetical protein
MNEEDTKRLRQWQEHVELALWHLLLVCNASEKPADEVLARMRKVKELLELLPAGLVGGPPACPKCGGQGCYCALSLLARIARIKEGQ